MSLYGCKVLFTVVFYSDPPVSKRSAGNWGERENGSKGGEVTDDFYLKNQ